MLGLSIALAVIVIGGFLWFAIDRTVRAHRQQAYWGREELTGKTAVARTALNPKGLVFYDGELWSAEAEGGSVKAGEEVVIKRVESLTLIVTSKGGGK
jgi:membrane-bound serine protease (ClpP class)